MQVVHTFNTDIAKQGTVEELPDTVAKTLIKTGRAREATEEEITAGRVVEPVPADDQLVTGTDEQKASPAAAAAAAETASTPPALEASADTATPPPGPTSTKAEPKKSAGPSSSSAPTPGK